ncbi:MAG: 2-hydroxyacid dehydrogenase [Propionibacteriaceae bacterium]|nr:2-hydroxyacid dehydrogenase [Propionibacteriaceae bacterium]
MGIKVWLPFGDMAEAEAALGQLPEGIDADFFLAAGQVPSTISDVEFLVAPAMRPGSVVMEQVDQMVKLRYVQIQGAGYETFLPYLKPGVTLLNAAGVHDPSTAELAIGLVLTSLRKLDRFARNMESASWERIRSQSLADRRVMIVGYGHIGKAIEKRLESFDVASVTLVARHSRAENGKQIHGIQELHALLPTAEIVIIICPLTPETERLFGAEEFSLMAPGTLVVNVARGKIIDTDALVAVLESGRIRAALDVVDPEPLPSDHRLWSTPGVYLTPHVGGFTDAMPPRANQLIAEQLRRLANGDRLLNQVAVGILPDSRDGSSYILHARRGDS